MRLNKMTLPDSCFSPDERRELLDDYFADIDRWHALDLSPGDGEDSSPLGGAFDAEALITRITDYMYLYTKGVPVLPLSRCPLSGAIIFHSIDTFGLDGLWWNYEAPVRPLSALPSTCFALSGALAPGGRAEWTPFLVKPGPAVPYVVPRILNHPSMKAVISSVRVGAHLGFPLFYFTGDRPVGLERINTWGTGKYEISGNDGSTGWNEALDDEKDYDFELAPWIEKGKLLWIDPGDSTLTLRNENAGCPYIGLEGTREIQRMERGRIWTPSMLIT